MLRPVARSLIGIAWGLLAGLVITFAMVVARARLQGVFLHSFDELEGWISLPMVIFPLLGARFAASSRYRLGPAALAGLVGLALGIAVGALAGHLLSNDPAWTWAGGVMGSAVGLVAGSVGRAVRDIREVRWGERGGAAAAGLVLVLLWGGACNDPHTPLPEPGTYEEPDPADVESVVYLVGDPGMARMHTYPVLSVVRSDVELWAERLPEGRVVLLILGDILYPEGLHEPSSRRFPEDSARVDDQVALVAGPAAREAEARGFFLPGNHDWGQRRDVEGAVRLHRLDDFLRRRAARGIGVSLEPPAGTGGPTVVDVGSRLRLVLLDTAWWLYAGEPDTKWQVIEGVWDAMETAEGRRVVFAAHHPLRSGGPHGNLTTLGSTFGLRTILARSGALLQDLHSEPYRDLLARLRTVFAAVRPPDVFAGGHEHSLQVIRGVEDNAAAWHVVSGSASKLTDVKAITGTEFATSAPGYARLFVLTDGTLWLSVEATPPRYLSCPERDGTAEECMTEGVGAYRTVWAGALERISSEP